jgi:hypothetical protein
MARQIIILEQPGLPSDLRYHVAFWLSVPAQRQQFVANPDAKSRVMDITANELTALQDGSVVELIHEAIYPLNTPIGAIGTDLVARYNEAQAQVNANNPWNRYGTFYDGNSWTMISVP